MRKNQSSGGRVGVAAEEDADEQVVHGLGRRKVGVNPEFVAGLEIGNGCDGEGLAVASNAHINLGADEIKARVGSETQSAAAKEEKGQQQKSNALIHTASLDALTSRQ